MGNTCCSTDGGTAYSNNNLDDIELRGGDRRDPLTDSVQNNPHHANSTPDKNNKQPIITNPKLDGEGSSGLRPRTPPMCSKGRSSNKNNSPHHVTLLSPDKRNASGTQSMMSGGGGGGSRTKRRFLMSHAKQFEVLQRSMLAAHRNRKWRLLYSSDVHGQSVAACRQVCREALALGKKETTEGGSEQQDGQQEDSGCELPNPPQDKPMILLLQTNHIVEQSKCDDAGDYGVPSAVCLGLYLSRFPKSTEKTFYSQAECFLFSFCAPVSDDMTIAVNGDVLCVAPKGEPQHQVGGNNNNIDENDNINNHNDRLVNDSAAHPLAGSNSNVIHSRNCESRSLPLHIARPHYMAAAAGADVNDDMERSLSPHRPPVNGKTYTNKKCTSATDDDALSNIEVSDLTLTLATNTVALSRHGTPPPPLNNNAAAAAVHQRVLSYYDSTGSQDVIHNHTNNRPMRRSSSAYLLGLQDILISEMTDTNHMANGGNDDDAEEESMWWASPTTLSATTSEVSSISGTASSSSSVGSVAQWLEVDTPPPTAAATTSSKRRARRHHNHHKDTAEHRTPKAASITESTILTPRSTESPQKKGKKGGDSDATDEASHGISPIPRIHVQKGNVVRTTALKLLLPSARKSERKVCALRTEDGSLLIWSGSLNKPPMFILTKDLKQVVCKVDKHFLRHLRADHHHGHHGGKKKESQNHTRATTATPTSKVLDDKGAAALCDDTVPTQNSSMANHPHYCHGSTAGAALNGCTDESFGGTSVSNHNNNNNNNADVSLLSSRTCPAELLDSTMPHAAAAASKPTAPPSTSNTPTKVVATPLLRKASPLFSEWGSNKRDFNAAVSRVQVCTIGSTPAIVTADN